MTPPNPLKTIQETIERVLHDSGITDFGRSMSSIDDLTAEVQHVYQRVDEIERVLETIVPILEKLTVVFEEIHEELEPISELASKVPGSGSRRRRREKIEAGLLTPGAPLRPSAARQARGATGDGPRAVPGTAGTSAGSGATSSRPVGPGTSAGPATSQARPGSSDASDASSADHGGGSSAPRPGATGYAPLGSRPPRDET